MSALASDTTVTYGTPYTAGGPASCTVTATNSASLSATSAVLTATLTL